MRVMFGPHAVYTCGEDVLREVARRAAESGLGIHVHLSETANEVAAASAEYGRTPIAMAAAAGLLGPSTLVAHATKATVDDIRLLAEAVSLQRGTAEDAGAWAVHDALAAATVHVAAAIGFTPASLAPGDARRRSRRLRRRTSTPTERRTADTGRGTHPLRGAPYRRTPQRPRSGLAARVMTDRQGPRRTSDRPPGSTDTRTHA
ncbi:amidohydrolase family protein [Actinomadura sp. NAK00032]|nr:amidohydrolase family protein [Actinomadura sp. NAK00032]